MPGQGVVLLDVADEIAALGADAFALQGASAAAELGLRQAIEVLGEVVIAAFERLVALGLEGAVVDAGVAAGGGKRGIEMIGPTLAPGVEDRLAVPGALLLHGEARGRSVVELPSRVMRTAARCGRPSCAAVWRMVRSTRMPRAVSCSAM